MIQRIQSVYLFTGAVLLLAMMFLDALAESSAALDLAWFVPAVLVLAGVAAAAALTAIFLYKDRRRQARIVLVAQIVTIICMILLYGGFYVSGDLVFRPDRVDLAILLLLPILAYIQFHLARGKIRKDVELVKSMDRLR